MKIGIFPLNLVLFPQSLYPLHIFEERYKELIKECIDNELEFGVNLVSNSKFFEIGCTAKVVDLFKKYEDGKLDITIEGVRKYKLLSFSEGERSFYTGEIELIEEDETTILDYQLFMDCVEFYNKIVDKIQGFHLEKIKIGGLHTKLPSYFIAQKAGLTPEQKQNLLEINNENKRLEFMLKHLKRIAPVVEQAEVTNRIIRLDGYIKPKFKE